MSSLRPYSFFISPMTSIKTITLFAPRFVLPLFLLGVLSCTQPQKSDSSTSTGRDLIGISVALDAKQDAKQKAAPHCITENAETDVMAGARAFAGNGFKYCGASMIGKRDPSVVACMRASIKSHTPFVAKYQAMGKDGAMTGAFAGNHDGKLTSLWADFYGPCVNDPQCWGCAIQHHCQSIALGKRNDSENLYCVQFPSSSPTQ